MVAVTLPNLIDFDQAKHVLVWPPTHTCNGWVNFIDQHIMKQLFFTSAYVFIAFIFSDLFDSTKTQQPATHLSFHTF